MNVDAINEGLFAACTDYSQLFPRLRQLNSSPFKFPINFGLDSLPEEPGIILVRGARQYGKSTWLEQQAMSSVLQFGPGSTAYLNGDEIRDSAELLIKIRSLARVMRPGVSKRIFIDEITAVDDWERALKIAADAGELREILVVTTGSRATDIRRGAERLPGRKGKLARTDYIFTPVSFSGFRSVVDAEFNSDGNCVVGDNALPLSKLALIYLLSGGSPVALTELLIREELPEWVITMTRDWIIGEFSRSGRNRSSLTAVIEQIFKQAMNPVGFTSLARESGVANNTIVAEYVELLTDLFVAAPCYVWDNNKGVILRRKPAKFHFINLLAAVSLSPLRLRSVGQFLKLTPQQQAPWLEWLVAQELFRRQAVNGEEQPELLKFWQTKDHEIDFVVKPAELFEVKRGITSALEFSWYLDRFPKAQLTVVSPGRFSAKQIKGITFDEFLGGE